MGRARQPAPTTWRNIAAFWLFGLCNNYGYVIMLSAADDIIHKQAEGVPFNKKCMEEIETRSCHGRASTGAILLAEIFPILVIKIVMPFFCHKIPYGFRHFIVVALQFSAYLVVAYATSFEMAIFGVAMAAVGSGIGEITYLSLSSHFPISTIAAWSSGTGGAGIVGSFAYAALTEPQLGGLTPRMTMLIMLTIPVAFAVAYWVVLQFPKTVYSPGCSPSSWLVPEDIGRREKRMSACCTEIREVLNAQPLLEAGDESHLASQRSLTFGDRVNLIKPLLKFMVPLMLVYFGEYLINQGLTQLVYFNCANGLGLSKGSQYRWYQVLYQVGVFISRSSVRFIELPQKVLYLLPILQLANAVLFYIEARYAFVPHIWIVFAVILMEGLYGGSSYVNTFNHIHKHVPVDVREYSLSIASLADSIGIVGAAFTGILLHNNICDQLG
ncbi:unnamed protein product, partial [Mesorhabditis spiculigera]